MMIDSARISFFKNGTAQLLASGVGVEIEVALLAWTQ
jgi:hypothetical protein